MREWGRLALLATAAPCLLTAAAENGAVLPSDAPLWRLDMASQEWLSELQDAHQPRIPALLDGFAWPSVSPLYAMRSSEGETHFSVRGAAGQRSDMRWALPLSGAEVSGSGFFVLRYRAVGIRRQDGPPRSVVWISRPEDAGDVVLLDCRQAICDGLVHTMVGRLPDGMVGESLHVEVSTMDSEAFVALETLAFHADLPGLTPAAVLGLASDGDTPEGFTELDLTGLFNDTLAAAFDRNMSRNGVVSDGCPGLEAGRLVVAGVPFMIEGETTRIVLPPERDRSEGLTVDYLGESLARRDFMPLGRDDATEVPVGWKVCEVHFLLAGELPVWTARYALQPAPFRINDVEAFIVELRYADGTCDEAFPYSRADEGHVMGRALGAYVVAADPTRELASVVFRNRLMGTTFSPVAVTVNHSGRPVVPWLAEDPAPVPVPRYAAPDERPARIERDGDTLVLSNTYYEITVNTAQGFSLVRMANRWAPGVPIALHPASGLAVALEPGQTILREADQLTDGVRETVVPDGGLTLTGRAFTATNVQVEGTRAVIDLVSPEHAPALRLRVTLTVDQTPELAMALEAKNDGAEMLKATFQFPALRDLTIGGEPDTWVHFPGYRSLNTNEPLFVQNDYGVSFTCPFFDAYNPVEGVGLMVLSHNNVDLYPTQFAMGKDERGVTCSVDYTSHYHALAAGASFRTPATRLIAFQGDWRDAAETYRAWKDTWFQAQRAAESDWYRKSFLLRCHILGETVAREIQRTRSLVDKATWAYRTDETMAADRTYWGGLRPDIFHFYGWHYRDDIKEYAWGEYALPEVYDRIGGLDRFREAIAHLQDDLEVPVSLYTLGDRASSSTKAMGRLGESAAQLNADLSRKDYADFRLLCLGDKAWQDHYMDDIVRLQRDTAAKLIYLDVFPTGATCYADTHDHETPMWNTRLNHRVTRRVRDAFPPEVVFFGEYPFTDVDAQCADGYLTYYNLSMWEHFGKEFNKPERAPHYAEAPLSLNRFLFPGLKQFAFPCGIEQYNASEQKIPFLNGDAMYDSTWWLRVERVQKTLVRAMGVLQRYADCFATTRPEVHIPTLREGIVANAFPTRDRTVYMLYNTRYQTCRGPVLEVAHVPGTTYRDLWADEPLSPEIHGDRAVLSVPLAPQGLGAFCRVAPS